MAETKTHVAQVEFLVEDEPNGRPSIRIQQHYTPGIPLLRYGSLKLDLDEGVDRAEAERLAETLNGRVHALIYNGEDLAQRDA